MILGCLKINTSRALENWIWDI